ncbi:MAG: hypothetical protein Q9172_007612 [Xanthocarpia lactea]
MERIGWMMAKALAGDGARKIYIVGRRREILEAAAKEFPSGKIIPLVGDVTSKDLLQSFASHVEKDAGYANLVAIWDMLSDDYTQTFAVNVAAVHFTPVVFLHLLHAGNERSNMQQKCQVVVTSSIAGFDRDVPGGYAYGQSRAAATHLAKQMATQTVPYGIRANVIAPGLYPWELAWPIIGTGVFPKEKIPAELVGSEEDMAGTILYMTSQAGAYLNEMF